MEVGSGMEDLAIRDVAARTGIAAGTIRMWEQRYGFPVPRRTANGYRRYTAEDVAVLGRVAAHREQGLSVPAALERARASGGPDRPSIFAAVALDDGVGRPRFLRKRTLLALSRAIEDETLAHAASPICFAAFQQEAFYRDVEHRYRRIAQGSDATIVFADFPGLRDVAGGPIEIPFEPDGALGEEWAVIVDAPGYSACLLAWEEPGRAERGGPQDAERRFEAVWTIEPRVTRRAAHVAARLAGRADADLGRRLDALLEDRPMALETPAPALTALTNRVISYLDT